MLDSFIFLTALAAVGTIAYWSTHLIAHTLRTHRFKQLVEKARLRAIALQHQRFNKPWFNYTTGRLHASIARG